MNSISTLRATLRRIDGRGYKAYKDIQGSYEGNGYTLYIDHVQGDPFATPSKVRVRVPAQVAQLPEALFSTLVRRVALEDFLARKVRQAIRRHGGGVHGTGKSGLIYVDAGAQEILQRTAVVVTGDWVEARLQVGLPAAGRTVLGKQAERLLCEQLPRIAEESLRWAKLPRETARQFVECVENQEHIRQQLEALGLVAFVADGAILPRKSGVSDEPMASTRAVAFRAPESLRVTVEVPNPLLHSGERHLTGMGIPAGITLIVGGGYHGKSTLLKALERGVYPHIPGDGREYVVTHPAAVKIRAEDGRYVEQVDISPFITNLPRGGTTTDFSTDDASGSTSQAANIMEALEVGAKVLLVDEDTSATNFMVRDARMQRLVAKAQEPITPFVDRVRELYERFGVSTILVMGGSGDYLDVADTVIQMQEYVPHDVTEAAKAVCRELPTRREVEVPAPMQEITRRIPLPDSFDPSRGKKEVKIDAKGLDVIVYGREPIELRHVEQLVDVSQTRAIGHAIHLAVAKGFMDGRASLKEVVMALERFF
ncbi:MAG: ATPase, partial [Calditrichaeota bacterium]